MLAPRDLLRSEIAVVWCIRDFSTVVFGVLNEGLLLKYGEAKFEFKVS